MSVSGLGALEFHEIRRSFAGTGLVIDGVSATIAPGEFVAILGPSGCGKSTLLRLAAGLDHAQGGEVRFAQANDEPLARGFVFQEAHLLPWLSVLDNVALPLELLGCAKNTALGRARQALDQVGLSEALARYPAELSGGMRMRVSVARALVTEPQLLLLDEPFAALDEDTRHRLQEELRSLWSRRSMTVLFVTHSVSEAVFVADRALVLSTRPARVLADHRIRLPLDRPSQIRTEPEFIAEMKVVSAAFHKGRTA
ncbi:MAG: ABC transporter ATP-binding protein [Bdellovibrionaceae bacterium]|nr:ABC transporter ATP-binding protein [Pseudobdellovibrionaceae bacterium]